jgi:hypothetical protein
LKQLSVDGVKASCRENGHEVEKVLTVAASFSRQRALARRDRRPATHRRLVASLQLCGWPSRGDLRV